MSQTACGPFALCPHRSGLGRPARTKWTARRNRFGLWQLCRSRRDVSDVEQSHQHRRPRHHELGLPPHLHSPRPRNRLGAIHRDKPTRRPRRPRPPLLPTGENVAYFDYSSPSPSTNYFLNVTCTVGNYYSQFSSPAQFQFTTPTVSGMRQEALFVAGNLFSTAIDATDPLLAAYNGGAPHFFTAQSVTAHPSGTVSMQMPFGTPVQTLIEVFTNSGWHDLGVFAPDSNGLYWISYPACLLGPSAAVSRRGGISSTGRL